MEVSCQRPVLETPVTGNRSDDTLRTDPLKRSVRNSLGELAPLAYQSTHRCSLGEVLVHVESPQAPISETMSENSQWTSMRPVSRLARYVPVEGWMLVRPRES